MTVLRVFALVAGLAAGLAIGAFRSVTPNVEEVSATALALRIDDTLALAHLDSLAELIVAADPWGTRGDAEPMSYALQPAELQTVPVSEPYVLRGIVGGPPWTALVEGLPGSSRTLAVATGDTSDTWRIVAVTRDSVVVRAAGTSITLFVTRSWR